MGGEIFTQFAFLFPAHHAIGMSKNSPLQMKILIPPAKDYFPKWHG